MSGNRFREFEVFIGFASESKHIGEAVSEIIQETKLWDARAWNRGEVFKKGKGYFESLFDELCEADYAIFIASPLDKTSERKVQSYKPRDNVMLEYGLFSGRNGRLNTALFEIGEPDLPSDLKGVTNYKIDVGNLKKNTPSLREKLRPKVEQCLDHFLSVNEERESLIHDASRRLLRLQDQDKVRVLATASRLRCEQVGIEYVDPQCVKDTLRQIADDEMKSVGLEGVVTEVPRYFQVQKTTTRQREELATNAAYVIRSVLLGMEENEGTGLNPSRIGVHLRSEKDEEFTVEVMARVAQLLNLPPIFVDSKNRTVKGFLIDGDELIFLHDFTTSGMTPRRCIRLLQNENVRVSLALCLVLQDYNPVSVKKNFANVGVKFQPLWRAQTKDNRLNLTCDSPA